MNNSAFSHLLENPLKLLKALSLHGPRPYEKENGKSSRVKDVDAPGVEEEDVPEVGEAGSAENVHKTLKREAFLDHDEVAATSVIHFLTKTLPPSEKTFLVLSEVRLPLDLGNILFVSYRLIFIKCIGTTVIS